MPFFYLKLPNYIKVLVLINALNKLNNTFLEVDDSVFLYLAIRKITTSYLIYKYILHL